MRRLLLAEYYKVSTTKLWWALLIPVTFIGLVIGFAGAAIAGLPAIVEETGGTLPAVALSLPIAMEQCTTFAVVLGLIGGAGEFRHKTITTSYLTAPSRGAVLAAKAVVYGGLGALYGLATMAACATGAGLRSGSSTFPSLYDTVVIAAAGIAGVAIWCVIGVGIGTLVSNQVAALIVVLIYMLFAEGLISLILRIPQLGTAELAVYLPGAGSTALQTHHGINVVAETFGDEAFGAREALEDLVGVSDQLSWFGGGLLVAAYAAAFAAAGWFVAGRRDIT